MNEGHESTGQSRRAAEQQRRAADALRASPDYRAREQVAHAISLATTAVTGIGMPLGAWAGRGDYATFAEETRVRQGERALRELDAGIAGLAEVRERLAATLREQGADTGEQEPQQARGGHDRPADDEVRELARQAFRTAGQIQLLTERMAALEFRVDGYSPAQMSEFAASLRGMATRAALNIDDAALLRELTGRGFGRLDLGGTGLEG